MGAELKAKLSLDTSPYGQAMNRIKAHNLSLGIGIDNLKNKLVQCFEPSRILEQTKALAEQAREIANGASKLNVSTQRFQDLDKAADKTGTSMEAVSTAYKKLAVGAQAALSGDKSMTAAFESLGASVKDLKNLSPDELFAKIAYNLERMGIAGPQVAAIMKTMGKSGDQLIPGFKSGAFNKADQFAMDPDQIKNLSKFKSNWSVYKNVAGAAMRNFMADSTDPNDGMLSGLFAKGAAYLRKKFGMEEETGAASKGSGGPSMAVIAQRAALEEAIEKFRFGGLTDEEKLLELTKRRADIEKQIANTRDEEERLKAGMALLGVDEQIAALQHSKADSTREVASARGGGHHDAGTNLVRLGNFAFTRGGANPMETTMTRQLQIQQKIEANTRPTKALNGSSDVP